MKFNLRKEVNRGKATWILDYRLAGNRIRSRHATKALAETALSEAEEEIKRSGESAALMTEAQKQEAVSIFLEAQKLGVTMREVWAGYLAGGRAAVRPRIELGEAVKLYVAAKRAAKRSPRYVDGLELYLEQFARGREAVQVAAMTSADIEAWFAGRDDSDSTKASDRFRVSGLFSFCVRRGYLDRNPCDALETVSMVHGPPSVLTPEQCRDALKWARGKPLLPWLVLGLVCGLRPEEADQTTAKHVDLKSGWLTVDAQSSKVRQRRVVHLTAQGKAWLAVCPKQHFALPRVTRRRWQRKLRDHLGIKKWPQDVLRHTFASFTMAEVQDAGKVAAEMGNSASVLMKHYRELMTKARAREYRKAMALKSPSPS